MYESFYGLKEKPFTLLPDPEYLYLSPKHQKALTLLEYGVMNKAGFSVICGDTGAGKTTLIRRLLSELTDETTVGLITNTHRSFGELLNWVLMAFGLDAENKTKAQMHQMFIEFLVTQYAKNKHTILIVDEAQNMEAETLEELRMLSNINADKDQVLQVILAGQPALKDTLRKPELMQFAQRISVDYYLEALNKDETAMYIHHRLKVAGAETQIFSTDACDAVYKYSGGTPRLINLLCDTSLVYGFAEQLKIIDSRLIDDVVREQHSNSILPTFNAPHNARVEIKEKANIDAVIADLGDRARKAVSNEERYGSNVEDAESNRRKAVQISENSESVEEIKRSIKDLQDVISGLTKEGVAKNYQEPIVDKLDNGNGRKPPEEIVEDEVSLKGYGADKDKGIYPIVHVEERSAKASPGSVLFVGVASGMLVATIAILIVGYVLFGETLKSTSNKDAVSVEIQNRQADIEKSKMELMVKERDTALALTKAMERERDAAITATKVQEEIRKAELRAAELIAEQERKTSLEVMRAKKRAQQAEYDAARSKESERLAKEEVRLAKIRAEEIRTKQLEEDAMLADIKKEAAVAAENASIAKREVITVPVPVAVDVLDNEKAKKLTSETEAASEFSANPCNSPSAKFLSTCKK